MPKKFTSKKSKKITQRNLSKVLSRTNQFSQAIDQAGAGIKPMARGKQVYYERITLGDGILAPYPYKFRLNDTFDPNETGSGHQPRGRDELAAIYNDYYVIAAKWEIRAVSNQTQNAYIWAHEDTNSTSDIVSIQDAVERGSSRVKMAYIRGNADGVSEEHVILRGSVPDMSKFASGSNSVAEQMVTGVGTNPATQVRLHIQAADEDESAVASGGIKVYVKITYDVVYKTPVATFSS